MSAKAYLTIDDSPSMRMDDMVDYLLKKSVPALFFCRGDFLKKHSMAAIRAVQSGFLLGNHTFSHSRSSEVDLDTFIDEIEQTEKMIEEIYIMAGYERPGKYFRFPQLDRGCGNAQPIDFNAMDLKQRDIVRSIFTEGLNVISAKKPSDEAVEKKEALQAYLKKEGFSCPCKEVSVPWYTETDEIQNAADSLFTFSTSDWMLTQRHAGRWRYKSLEDLMAKIDHDKWVLKKGMTSIVLLHDQAEIIDQSLALIDHMLEREIEFLEFV